MLARGFCLGMAGVPPGRRSQCGLLEELKRTYVINRWENLQIPLCLARASFPFYRELTPFPGRQNDVGRSRLKIGAWDERGGSWVCPTPSQELLQISLICDVSNFIRRRYSMYYLRN